MNNYVNVETKEKFGNSVYTGNTGFYQDNPVQAELDAILSNNSVNFATEEVENADLMPSQTTLEYKGTSSTDVFTATKTYSSVEVNTKYKISTKGKVLIAVYVLLIAMIFAFIAFNANFLRSLDNKIDTANEEVANLQLELDESLEKLNQASSDESIIEEAKKLGMI